MANGWGGGSSALLNMRVDINLATHRYEDARQFWMRWGGALLGLGILTIFLLSMTVNGWLGARKDRQLMRRYDDQSAARDKERADAMALLNLPQNSTTRDRSLFLNDLFQRKEFSWTKAFEDLERVMPPRLHVVSIHPQLAVDNELEIKLVVAGDSRDHALDLVSKMEASQHFHDTYIEEESSASGSSGPNGDTVEFHITALYVPEIGTLSQGGTP
jgi:Tfp pilus assembly protein PilN